MTRSGEAGRRAAAAMTLLGALALCYAAPAHAHDNDVVFQIQSDLIDESSSLVVSTVEPHLVYTANDSGDGANIYVLDDRSGELVGTATLAGVDAVDIEAMAAGDDGKLVVADIGDNDAVHPTVEIYRIEQPGPGDATVTPEVVSLTYPGGPRDAESALYDASSGRVFVVSKEFQNPRVYRTPPQVFDRQQAVLEPVAPVPSIATDATFLPSGDVVVIRTYLDAVFYSYPAWRQLAEEPLPLQPQGESLAAPDDRHIWVGSEGDHTSVLSVEVPDLTATQPTTSPTTTSGSDEPTDPVADDGGDHAVAARNVVVVSGALLLVVLVIGVVRYRRHHPHED